MKVTPNTPGDAPGSNTSSPTQSPLAQTSAVQPSSVPQAETASPQPFPSGDHDFDALQTLTRLAIGSACETADALGLLLRRWQAEAAAAAAEEATTTSARLRYALLGLLFEGQDRMEASVGQWTNSSAKMAQRMLGRLARTWRRVPAGRVPAHVDAMLSSSQATLDRWIARGRIEEREGRLLAREGAAEVTGILDDVLHHLAQDPAVRELIQQQSVGLASTAVDSLRDRARSADAWVDRTAQTFLHRTPREQNNHPPQNTTGAGTPDKQKGS